MEQANGQYIKTQELLKQEKGKFDQEFRIQEKFLSKLLEKSIEVKNLALTVEEKHFSHHQNKKSFSSN